MDRMEEVEGLIGHLDLDGVIAALKAEDPAKVLPLGFHHPHSWRGVYSELAFEPVENISVGEMLAAARSAVGATYEGYKGGDYKMLGWTECHLDWEGCSTGETVGRLMLRQMLAAGKVPE